MSELCLSCFNNSYTRTWRTEKLKCGYYEIYYIFYFDIYHIIFIMIKSSYCKLIIASLSVLPKLSISTGLVSWEWISWSAAVTSMTTQIRKFQGVICTICSFLLFTGFFWKIRPRGHIITWGIFLLLWFWRCLFTCALLQRHWSCSTYLGYFPPSVLQM